MQLMGSSPLQSTCTSTIQEVLSTNDANGTELGEAQQNEGQMNEWITVQLKKAKKDEKRECK
jgi:hypothetical protein